MFNIADKVEKSKIGKLMSCLSLSLLTLGVISTAYSFTFNIDVGETLEAMNKIKNHYIEAVEVEAQVTTVSDNKNKLILSLVDDSSKFWIIDKGEFATDKDDFERVMIIVDSNLNNVIRGEQYLLDGEFYNLLDEGVNKDELTELDYSTYKELESSYVENISDVTTCKVVRRIGVTSIVLGLLLYVIKFFIL